MLNLIISKSVQEGEAIVVIILFQQLLLLGGSPNIEEIIHGSISRIPDVLLLDLSLLGGSSIDDGVGIGDLLGGLVTRSTRLAGSLAGRESEAAKRRSSCTQA